MARHITDAPPNPRMLEPSISHATAKLVVKCLQKNPADRFADADDIVKEVDRILEGTIDGSPATSKTRSQLNRIARESSREEEATRAAPPSGRKRRFRRKRDESS